MQIISAKQSLCLPSCVWKKIRLYSSIILRFKKTKNTDRSIFGLTRLWVSRTEVLELIQNRVLSTLLCLAMKPGLTAYMCTPKKRLCPAPSKE